MAEIKRKFKVFLITQENEEQRWLEQQHRNGWKLCKVNYSVYTFEKCEPEEVVYQLNYNTEGQQDELESKGCGWEYVCDFSGYSYFRKPKAEITEENNSFRHMPHEQMIKRMFRSRVLPLLIIFCICVVPGVIRSYCRQSWGLFGFWAVMAVLYVVLLAGYAVAYYKDKHKK